MSKNLSEIISGIFAKVKPGEDLTPKFQLLRDELQKTLEGDAFVVGKFRGLLDSFRDVIPDEQQRYQAAVKALSTTLKLDQKGIVAAVNDQLAALKMAEKDLLAALPGRDALTSLEKKAEGIRTEIAKLQEAVGKLQEEEKAVLASKAAREKDWQAVDKAVKDVFANVSAETAAVRSRIEGLSAEPAAAPAAQKKEPAQSGGPSVRPVEKKDDAEQGLGGQAQAPPMDPKYQKKCPQCGGQFNLIEHAKLWQCFNCAYEEPAGGA